MLRKKSIIAPEMTRKGWKWDGFGLEKEARTTEEQSNLKDTGKGPHVLAREVILSPKP